MQLYLIQPSPVQFTFESQDLVFFNGSDITLHCETNCVQLGLTNISCAVGFLHNGCDLDYCEPSFDMHQTNDIVIGRRTLTILNANNSANGQYQCFTYSRSYGRRPLTDRIIGRPIHLQIATLEPVGEEIQRVNVSEGGDIELPCMKGIFPSPSSISWWRNGDRCDSLQQCLDNIKILPNGDLQLSSATYNVSGDYFYCEIGWINDKSYNATYQIVIDNSVNVTSKASLLKVESPAIVFLNATVDYVSEGSVSYYKSDMLVDLRNVDDYLINVTITCTFSGHPRPQVKWFLNGLNVSECIDTTNIVTEGNTSILYLSTTNSKSFFGSYQCVVDNEAGYFSNITRILPKGWSNPPKIFSAKFNGTDITIRWRPPDYTGGETVNYYSVEFIHSHMRTNKLTLEKKTISESYTLKNVDVYYGLNGQFDFYFMIKVVNSETAAAISSAAVITINSHSEAVHPEIRQLDCSENNVMVTWVNHNQNAYSDIWDHCINYNCSTPGGNVTGTFCTLLIRRNNVFTSQHSMELNDVPLNSICSFRVSVFSHGYNYQWSNRERCTRNLSSTVVTSKMMDQRHTKGDTAIFICQATSEPVSNIIQWYFNGIPINESDKYQISTELLNYTTTNNTLTVMNVESSDVGTYTCNVSNGRSADTSSGVISVNEKPTITSSVQEFNGTEGDVITCTTTGYPVPDIVWLNSDGSVVDKNRLIPGSAVATGIGNLFNVSLSMIIGRNDAGVYTCIANNSIGYDIHTIDIFSVTSTPVIIALDEEAYELTEGDDIACTATGYPAPDIVWLYNDGSVVDKNRIKTDAAMATGVGNLISVSVSMTIGRPGIYVCAANNSIGNDNRTINIFVHSIPIIFTPESKAYKITEGGAITCVATGYPAPDIVWLNSNGSVVNKDRLIPGSPIATSISYLINISVSLIVRRGDDGVYICVASNLYGSDNSTINITVKLAHNEGQAASDATSRQSKSGFWIGISAIIILSVLIILLFVILLMLLCKRKANADIRHEENKKNVSSSVKIADYGKLSKDIKLNVYTYS